MTQGASTVQTGFTKIRIYFFVCVFIFGGISNKNKIIHLFIDISFSVLSITLKTKKTKNPFFLSSLFSFHYYLFIQINKYWFYWSYKYIYRLLFHVSPFIDSCPFVLSELSRSRIRYTYKKKTRKIKGIIIMESHTGEIMVWKLADLTIKMHKLEIH